MNHEFAFAVRTCKRQTTSHAQNPIAMKLMQRTSFLLTALYVGSSTVVALSSLCNRRQAMGALTTGAITTVVSTQVNAEEKEIPDRLNVEDYLRNGFVSNPMGVSGQAGKSKPETGVVLRDGSEVSRDPRSGDVLAEILVSGGDNMVPILASFSSPWPLQTGTVFDVECRDPSTGDGAFLAVSRKTSGQSLAQLNDAFFLNDLFAPTGRFSFYGSPTDVKVKSSSLFQGNNGSSYKVMDVSFSTLSQSTQSEIPRRARIVATIPSGSQQAVLLVGSASALRWKKGSEEQIQKVMSSFQAIPAPVTGLKLRSKERRSSV